MGRWGAALPGRPGRRVRDVVRRFRQDVRIGRCGWKQDHREDGRHPARRGHAGTGRVSNRAFVVLPGRYRVSVGVKKDVLLAHQRADDDLRGFAGKAAKVGCSHGDERTHQQRQQREACGDMAPVLS